jgi:hypothetical protein
MYYFLLKRNKIVNIFEIGKTIKEEILSHFKVSVEITIEISIHL